MHRTGRKSLRECLLCRLVSKWFDLKPILIKTIKHKSKLPQSSAGKRTGSNIFKYYFVASNTDILWACYTFLDYVTSTKDWLTMKDSNITNQTRVYTHHYNSSMICHVILEITVPNCHKNSHEYYGVHRRILYMTFPTDTHCC